MKNVKFLSMMMLVVVMALVTACSKDDDGGGNGSIVGSWVQRGDHSDSVERYIFNGDGTCSSYADYGSSEPGRYSTKYGTYSVNGSSLSINYTKKVSAYNGQVTETTISESKTYTFAINDNKLLLTREGRSNPDTYIRE